MTDAAFLLDTNICIYLLEGLSPLARDRVQQCAPGQIVTSAIVFAEVMRGIDRTNIQAVAAVNAFFELFEVQPFDVAAAETYARIPFKRARFDRLIAAHALSLGLSVVTANEADFAGIAGLKVENWTLP